jgi:hypothetical protein
MVNQSQRFLFKTNETAKEKSSILSVLGPDSVQGSLVPSRSWTSSPDSLAIPGFDPKQAGYGVSIPRLGL